MSKHQRAGAYKRKRLGGHRGVGERLCQRKECMRAFVVLCGSGLDQVGPESIEKAGEADEVTVKPYTAYKELLRGDLSAVEALNRSHHSHILN